MQADGSLHEFDLSDVQLDSEVLRTVKISLAHRYYVGSTSPPPEKLPDNTEMRQLAAQRAQNVRDAILAAGDIAGERISIVTASPLSAEERAKLKGRPNRVDFSMK